ncbi:hypothetical protein M5D96_012569 [Drosophila gunungcola]|uniref:Secreted protein n=1 Tax=Drosophila gunungcola TaxID=103775 RepID=A0A9P9YDD7_9MUSC|nr:hypothetical protein M5D96_012569 [Drosophila gunungcola]
MFVNCVFLLCFRVSSIAAVKSEEIGQESKRYFGISSLSAVTPVGICQGAWKHLRQSFVHRRSQVRGNRTGVKTLFWHLIPRRSHTSRDLSRSQETFETVSTLIIASSAGSGQGARDASEADICRF